MIVFVSGGARSGKSGVAEALALERQRLRGGRRYYLATANAGDAEMAARIDRHRRDRGAGWLTLEAPLELAQTVTGVAAGSVVLLDCLTLWASQWLYAAGRDEATGWAVLEASMDESRRRGIDLIVVSNDLNEGLPPEDAETWRYVDFLQRAHRRVAAEADVAIRVVAGLPQYWKGQP